MTHPTARQVALWCIVGCVLLGAVLRLSGLVSVSARTPDERTYTAQAVVMLSEGLPGLRRLATDYVNDPDRAVPPPSRIGYTAPIAGMMALAGRSDERIGAAISCLASIAGLGLIALIGLRFFDPWVAVVATFLLATFPPDLVIARRAWSDAWVACLTYALLNCVLLLARGERSRRVTIAVLVTGSIFALTKEIAAIVWVFCALWIVISQRRASVPIVVEMALVGLVSLAFLSWAVGGASVFWDIVSRQGTMHAANSYSREYQSGPAYWLLESFWITSPWTSALALVGMVTAPFAGLWRDRRAAVAVPVFALVILALPAVLPAWLNLRFASPVFGPLCILAAAALMLGFKTLKERIPAAVLPLIVAVGCAGLAAAGLRDYRYFDRWFVSTGTADLSVRMVFATDGREGTLPPLGESQPRAARPDSPSVIAERFLSMSVELYHQGQYDDSIAAARQALALRPGYAEAHNNIAAAYASKGMWDEAIQAAEVAIRLKPDFQLAKNNLAWARTEKAKRDAPVSGSR